MNPETSSRREREYEAHRQQVMDAAEEVFGARGYNAVTIEEIAGRAGFSVGSIYNFFGGKRDLFDQVLRRIAESRVTDMDGRVLPLVGRPWEALRLFCSLWMEHHVKHGGFLLMALGNRLTEGGRLFDGDDAGSRLAREYHSKVLEFFSRFVENAGVRHLAPEECFHVFEGTGRSLLFHRGRRDRGGVLQVADPLDQTFYGLVRKVFRGGEAAAPAAPARHGRGTKE